MHHFHTSRSAKGRLEGLNAILSETITPVRSSSNVTSSPRMVSHFMKPQSTTSGCNFAGGNCTRRFHAAIASSASANVTDGRWARHVWSEQQTENGLVSGPSQRAIATAPQKGHCKGWLIGMRAELNLKAAMVKCSSEHA